MKNAFEFFLIFKKLNFFVFPFFKKNIEMRFPSELATKNPFIIVKW